MPDQFDSLLDVIERKDRELAEALESKALSELFWRPIIDWAFQRLRERGPGLAIRTVLGDLPPPGKLLMGEDNRHE